ncbi:MAG: ABC transporter ATP-binding protein, partial [Pseudomonadota bacterium]
LGAVAFVMALVLRLHLLSNRLLGNLNGFFRNVGVTQNTMELVARPHGLANQPGATPLDFKNGEIEFREVSFHYDKAEGVLDAISLKVKGGEKIGIVGSSGSGKTTLVHLMMRFFDPEKGSILFDGQDIASVTQESLRSHFSLVQQDVQLFHQSVSENIAYGDLEGDAARIEMAAKQADAHDFIVELRDKNGRIGYDAKVGERGVKLSGGQRQRIAIARAIYRDAPVMVFDEATSQLDSLTEKNIQQIFLKQMSSKTVFMIAHRLSTLMHMDRIIVLEQGKIVQEGTHAELIGQDGPYGQLWRQQQGEI